MTLGTKVSSQSALACSSVSGGQCWSMMLNGLYAPATSAKFIRPIVSISPPTVPVVGGLFCKAHLNTMVMLRSAGYQYIVQAHCTLTIYPKWWMLHSENSAFLTFFIFKDILCRWGPLAEIVTDNSPTFIQALDVLADQYQIRHIHISSYNSQVNGVVE